MATRKEICQMQDHTLLGHCCTKADVERCVNEVLKYGFKAICVNGANVAYAAELLQGRASVASVVGFPQGASTTASKIFEAVDAVRNGADEVDVVVNFPKIREKDYDYVKNELTEVVKAVKAENSKALVKFIIYMPYDHLSPLSLTEEEIGVIGQMIIDCGGDFIKYAGNHEYIIERFKEDVQQGRVMLKWSGCPDYETMLKAYEQGVTRIGHDGVPQWLEEHPELV